MATVLQIVNGAAEELGVKTAETALEAEDYQAILSRMNDMGEEWANIGLTPKFYTVTDSADIVDIDADAVGAFKYNLAIRCAPAFQRVVSQALASVAQSSLTRLRASADYIGNVAYPDTLPTGSGNDCGQSYSDDRFFTSNADRNF